MSTCLTRHEAEKPRHSESFLTSHSTPPHCHFNSDAAAPCCYGRVEGRYSVRSPLKSKVESGASCSLFNTFPLQDFSPEERKQDICVWSLPAPSLSAFSFIHGNEPDLDLPSFRLVSILFGHLLNSFYQWFKIHSLIKLTKPHSWYINEHNNIRTLENLLSLNKVQRFKICWGKFSFGSEATSRLFFLLVILLT